MNYCEWHGNPSSSLNSYYHTFDCCNATKNIILHCELSPTASRHKEKMANHSGPIPPWLTSSYVEKMLSDHFKKPNVTVKSIDITPGSNVGDNYSCQIFRIRTVYDANGEESKLSLIAKYMIPTKLMESVGGGQPFFVVESAFYNTLSPKISEITGNEDCIGPNVFYIDEEHTTIFMEDLTIMNYELQGRSNLLNLEQCYLTIDALATFHGSSYYAMKENPELKKIFHKYFWSSEPNEGCQALIKTSENAIKNNIDNYNLPQKQHDLLMNVFKTIEKDCFKVCDFQEDNINVLLHGDCWKSNLMFHFNGKIADAVKLLDFQIVNYNSFANDLQYFLFSSIEAKTLLDNIENILQRYYSKFIEVCPDMPNVSFDRIKREFQERYFFGFALAILFRGVFFSEEPADLEDSLNGVQNDLGYGDPRFIDELKLFLSYFENIVLL